ncbi:MAG: AraC family transcriptional regulator [Anaerolineales bacterium]
MPPSHQVRTLFKSNLLWVLDYRCSGQREPREEWPTAHEIILPRSGSYVRRDAFGKVVADPNQILFSNRNQPYEISHPIKREDRSTVILLRPDTLLEIARNFDASALDRPHAPFPRAGITADSRLHLSHYWLLSMDRQDFFNESLAVEEDLLTLLGEILARVFTTGPARSTRKLPGTLREHLDVVHRVKLVLDERFSEKLLLDEIASAVYSSPYHISRVFKRQTGLTIHLYQQRLRLLHAAERLIENPNENLDRIALDLGFANHSHFTTAFGKAFGLSPSDFRRSVTSRQIRQMSKILKV